MKKLLSLLFFLSITILNSFSQERMDKEFSYSQLFDQILSSKDSVFTLSNAFIKFDSTRDQRFSRSNEVFDTLFIGKQLVFKNVIFDRTGRMTYLSFQKSVVLSESGPLDIRNSRFQEKFNLSNTQKHLNQLVGRSESNFYRWSENKIENIFQVYMEGETVDLRLLPSLFFERNQMENSISKIPGVMNFTLDLRLQNSSQLLFTDNIISSPLNDISIFIDGDAYALMLERNNLRVRGTLLQATGNPQALIMRKNSIKAPILLQLSNIKSQDFISWEDFKGKVLSSLTYLLFQIQRSQGNSSPIDTLNPDLIDEYKSLHSIQDKDIFDGEISLLGKLYNHYKENHNRLSAASVFVEMKDLETSRLKYLFEQNQNFENFFTWKINQFLKLFSDYGTKPSKAIVFSVYVILAFALIYLFFPNSWDAHGKNRIVDRYRFFFKYLQRNAGVHEVYLEEKRQDLLGYEEFKSIITNSEKSVPRFFSATALPLYQWAVSGTQISAKILSKVDILKGTWEDLPGGQKAWKSFLLVGGFLIALVYDLLIKALNALMLSINTFTTLGFGEIPIKGLPRYLAIIQGFIGWFMLTIFSVSLISQLLN